MDKKQYTFDLAMWMQAVCDSCDPDNFGDCPGNCDGDGDDSEGPQDRNKWGHRCVVKNWYYTEKMEGFYKDPCSYCNDKDNRRCSVCPFSKNEALRPWLWAGGELRNHPCRKCGNLSKTMCEGCPVISEVTGIWKGQGPSVKEYLKEQREMEEAWKEFEESPCGKCTNDASRSGKMPECDNCEHYTEEDRKADDEEQDRVWRENMGREF